jgi:hypothetical protein
VRRDDYRVAWRMRMYDERRVDDEDRQSEWDEVWRQMTR